jgi:hypothetical protein
MALVAEVTFFLVLAGLATRWYLPTPMHRTRTHSGVQFPARAPGDT